MENKLYFKKLDPTRTTVQGREFAIEDRETGKVYITSKPYIDKLFSEMGYRNLGVIKILEDFASKYISDIGSLNRSEIFVDETTDSFVVASDKAVTWINDMFDKFESKGFEVTEVRHYDPYYYWDQFTVKSSTGTSFAIYVDLCDEYVQVLSLKFDDKDVLRGVINEGKYRFEEDGSLDSLINLMSFPIEADAENTPSQELSIREYVELLETLGLVAKKKKKYYFTEIGEDFKVRKGISDFLEDIVAEYNIMSWIQRHIKTIPGKFTFSDACELITPFLSQVRFWDVKDFYVSNAKETSDIFALNA